MKTPTLYSSNKDFSGACKGSFYLLLCAVVFFGAAAAAGSREPAPEPAALELTKPADPATPRTAADRTGSWPTSEGLTLRLTTDLGSVKIISLDATATPVVQYSVHIETDARASLARHLLDRYSLTAKATPAGVEIAGTLPPRRTRSANSAAQFWVRFEVTVPLNYNVEVKTEAGDIETQDTGGFANLATAGGHINVRNVAGDASLHSGGGHIRAGQIGGRADLQTDGGNITVGQAGSLVSVRTGGGQIDFGEVRGSVRAQTGGGGIRIMYVSGPMEVESSAGSICLTRVAGTVRAATAGGTITAWINPDAPSSGGKVQLAGLSQLTSGNGDIIVFLPRNLAADIDAQVESGGERRIEADPALALQIQNRGNGPVRATGALNGGGPSLKLRTTAGKIRLQFLDSQVALRQTLIQEQKERLMERLQTVQLTQTGFVKPQSWNAPEVASEPQDRGDWIDRWLSSLEATFLGNIHEDPDELQKHLMLAPPPAYPEIARRAGVQGIVRLQVRATKDGRIEVDKILSGSPTLADAAIAAVKQWRVRSFSTGGRPVDVISTVTFNFQLH